MLGGETSKEKPIPMKIVERKKMPKYSGCKLILKSPIRTSEKRRKIKEDKSVPQNKGHLKIDFK